MDTQKVEMLLGLALFSEYQSSFCHNNHLILSRGSTGGHRQLNLNNTIENSQNTANRNLYLYTTAHEPITLNVQHFTFLLPFSIKMLVIFAGIHKMLVRIANSEDHNQTSSSEAV